MGERKVQNFYISPDFDHSLIPRMKRDWSNIEVRMMLPFSLRCNTCGEYMYAGKKFNSKKENCDGEEYLGIRRFRFIIKCSNCSAIITFKTDPKNSDYECESGASRNFEVWRDTEDALNEAKKIREEEDKSDAMKSLENRTLDSKIEMDILDALDEMKSINQRHDRIDTSSLLASYSISNDINIKKAAENEQRLRDEEIIKSVLFKSKQKLMQPENADEFTEIISSTSSGQSLAEMVAKSVSKEQALKPVNLLPVKLNVIKKRKIVPEIDGKSIPKQISDNEHKVNNKYESVEPSNSIFDYNSDGSC